MFEIKRQMMRVIGSVVRKESFVVMNDRRFVAIVCWHNGVVLKNQTSTSIELIMNDLAKIGDYELLEKKNEGYTSN